MLWNLLFAALNLSLAVVYIAISYTSGAVPATRSSDLAAGALLYGPLLLAAVVTLFRIKDLVLDMRAFSLLASLMLGTVLMAVGGYNFAGLLFGTVNCVLAWVLAVKVWSLAFPRKKR